MTEAPPAGQLRDASEIDAGELHEFLRRFFGPVKADFLHRHGDWWHRGSENRLAVVCEGKLAAYCAVIPTRCRLPDGDRSALWWMDLVVAPEFRGRGLQTLLDLEVRRRTDLILGFPNELAARIHRKHGWGVREDLRAMMLPLRPRQLGFVRRGSGPRGALTRGLAAALEPAAAFFRWRLRAARALSARRLEDLDDSALDTLTAIADNLGDRWTTAVRDADHLRWRFLDAPYRDQLRFYVAGEPQPTVAGVCRYLPGDGGQVRLLDLFGNLEDRDAVLAALALAAAEAVTTGAAQVTALAAAPELAALLRRAGFLLSSTARFCWSSPDPALVGQIGGRELHWCLADSDNDEPA